MKYINIIFLIILSISLINTFINPEIPIELKINAEENFNIIALAKYTIDLSEIKNEKYILLEIEGEDQNTNYVLSIVDDFKSQNRIQLAQSVRGNTHLIASKEQIKGNTINIILECSNYSNCNGTLKKKSFNRIPLEENKPIYYYNTFDNMMMEFSIISSSKILNIWAKDDLEIITILEGALYTKYKNGNFYIVENNKNEITLKVKGKEGDYINVGFIGFSKNNKETNYYLTSTVMIDGYILTSYLNKDIVNKYCYKFETFDIINEKIIISGDILDNLLSYELGYYYNSVWRSTQGSFYDRKIYYDKYVKYSYLCLDNSKQNNKETVYTLQIYSKKSFDNQLKLFEPQNNGIFIKYIINPSNKRIIIPKIPKNSENILYYLYSSVSASYLYVMNCSNYPFCSLNESDFNKSSPILTIGKTSFINLKKDNIYDFSPINKYQKLYVVKCDNNAEKNCEVETLIGSDNKKINLMNFSDFIERYSVANQIDKYRINNLLNTTNRGIYNYLIEINIIAGEVDVITNFPKGTEFNKTINLNKISIFFNMEYKNTLDFLDFSIKNLRNSFYSITYSQNEFNNNLYSPKIYLTYGIPGLYNFSKNYYYDNLRNLILLRNININSYAYKTVNVRSLNCEIKIYKSGSKGYYRNKLLQYGSFYHLIPNKMDDSDSNENYLIDIEETDVSEYNNKVCQVYFSYLDNLVGQKNSNYINLLVIDNIPQQIMFNRNFIRVTYGYYLTKLENDIIIKYSSKHDVKYIAKIYYVNKKREKEEEIMGEGIIYLNFKEWKNICKNEACLIKIDISLNRTDFQANPESILEISIKSLEEKMVSYISKNQLIKDYIHYQKSQYYYTEIGKNEIGYINAHFLKGSGEIVANIVEVDKKESNPDWKGKYTLPTKDKAEFRMDTFTKKVKFSSEKYNCENKCYLIIKVFSDIKADKIPYDRVHPFTLFIKSNTKNLDEEYLPAIYIPFDEIILGSLEIGNGKGNYEFYKVQLNSNFDKIIIDIHSAIEKIFINVGDKRPTINNNHISLTLSNNNNDNVFVIYKEELLKYSTMPILTISLYSSKLDYNINTIPYSFSIRLSKEDGKNLYKINSEHLTLRNSNESQKVEGKYQLLYLIKYDYLNDNSSCIISAINSDKTNINLSIKAKYINYEDYLFERVDLTKFDFSNKDNETFIILKNGFEKDKTTKSVLISVELSEEKIVKFYASFYDYYNGIYIDPSSSSIKYVPKGESISLYVSNLYNNSIRFRHLGGKGEIYQEGKEQHYFLNNINNNLNLTLPDIGKDMIEIIVKEIDDSNNSIGFTFYLEQYLLYKEKENENDEKDKTILIIIITSCSSGIIIIAGIIVALIFYNKKKKLKDDINKISFIKEKEDYIYPNSDE